MNSEQLTTEVKGQAREIGARLVGVTEVERLSEAPKGHRPGDFLPGASSVVVMGLPILRAFGRFAEFLQDSEKVPEFVRRGGSDSIPILGGYMEVSFATRRLIGEHIYRRCAYEFLNMELRRLSFYLALYLEEKGYDAIYMPTTYGSSFTWNQTHPMPNMMGPMSTRHAAVAAGLGKFGMNNLLMTPKYGCMVRFVAVITSAKLQSDPLLEEEICLGEKCSVCKKKCPNDCFSELQEYDFGQAHARMWKIDSALCGGYTNKSRHVCERECLTACPLSSKRMS